MRAADRFPAVPNPSFLASAFEQAPAFIAITRGPELVVEYANAAYHRVGGQRQLVGLRVRDVLPELEGQGFFEILDQVYATGQPFHGEEMQVMLRRTADGPLEERFADFVYQPLFADDGSVDGLMAHGMDVTSRVHTRQALEAALREQQHILDYSLDIICSVDAKGRFVHVSAAAETVWGYTPAELEGKYFTDFVHPDDLARTAEIGVSVVAGGKVYAFENCYVRKDGEAVPMSWSAVWSVEDQRMMCVARDRSEALAQEQRLRTSEERLRLITEATTDVMWDWNLVSDQCWWSSGIVTALGYSEEEAARGDALWYGGIHPEDRDRVLDGIHAAIDAGETLWADEYRFLHADGTPITIHDRGRIIRDAHGKAVRMAGSMDDVTATRQAEAALVAAKERAEEMGRLKDAFLANMSHEIRTPLTAILGFTELLRDVVEEEGHPFVDMIEAGGRRLKDTLTSVLELSQLQTGGVEMKPTTVDVSRVVQETVDLLQAQASRKGVTLRVASEPVPIPAHLDRAALDRILTNLIGNAVKFTPAGGHVTVTAGQEEGRVRLSVSDTGIGIAPEFLPNLFEEFRQESLGFARTHEGNGLGLAITKRLVSLMGGTISVESRKRHGTTFTVLLPQGNHARPPAPATARQEASDASRRVLLVEDDESTRLFLTHALARLSVVEAASAEIAVAAAKDATEPFDVVLLDINLGNSRSGVDILPEIRAMPACQGARIVAMTAYALPGDEERFLAMGFDGYLPKPFPRAALDAAVAAR